MEILLTNNKINSLQPINSKDSTEPSKLTTDPTKLTSQATDPSNTNPTSDPKTHTNPTSLQTAPINPTSPNNPIIYPTTISGSTTILSVSIDNEVIILTIKSISDLSTVAI